MKWIVNNRFYDNLEYEHQLNVYDLMYAPMAVRVITTKSYYKKHVKFCINYYHAFIDSKLVFFPEKFL